MSDDPRYVRLLDAARVWRSGLLPRTSTGSLNAVNELLRAIEAFDSPQDADE